MGFEFTTFKGCRTGYTKYCIPNIPWGKMGNEGQSVLAPETQISCTVAKTKELTLPHNN